MNNEQITPTEKVSLQKAIDALERLPFVTSGTSIEYGIVYRAGTEDFSEMRYIDFSISDYSFEISIGGSVYDKAVGSDSFSRPGYLVELGGYRETECDLWSLEDDIAEYLNLGAEITVCDESVV